MPPLWSLSSARKRPRALLTLPVASASPRPTRTWQQWALWKARSKRTPPIDWRSLPDDPYAAPKASQGVLMGFEDLVTPVSEDPVYLRQRVLRDLPPAARTRYPRVPTALVELREWVKARVESGQIDASAARGVYLKVREMRLQDALYCGDYRLEFLWLRKGVPHYRIFHDIYLLGFVDVPLERESAHLTSVDVEDDDRYEVFGRQLPGIQRTLARHLAGFGWSAATCALVVGDARTGMNESKRDVYRLF